MTALGAACGGPPEAISWKCIGERAGARWESLGGQSAWGNLMIQLLKATSLVSLITLADLTYRAYQLHQLTMKTFPIFGAVLVIYFLMAQVIALATSWTDRRVGRWRRPGAPA